MEQQNTTNAAQGGDRQSPFADLSLIERREVARAIERANNAVGADVLAHEVLAEVESLQSELRAGVSSNPTVQAELSDASTLAIRSAAFLENEIAEYRGLIGAENNVTRAAGQYIELIRQAHDGDASARMALERARDELADVRAINESTRDTSATESDSDASDDMSQSERDARRAAAIRLLNEAGAENAPLLVDLHIATAAAERDTNLVTTDPVTGESFNALQLMDQLEREGKDRLGREFSERRGYSPAEIEAFEQYVEEVRKAESTGVDVAAISYAVAVADGQCELPAGLSKSPTEVEQTTKQSIADRVGSWTGERVEDLPQVKGWDQVRLMESANVSDTVPVPYRGEHVGLKTYGDGRYADEYSQETFRVLAVDKRGQALVYSETYHSAVGDTNGETKVMEADAAFRKVQQMRSTQTEHTEGRREGTPSGQAMAEAFSDARRHEDRQQAVERHPELVKAFAIEAAMIALSKHIEGDKAQQAFVDRVRENIATDLAQGRPLIDMPLKASARAVTDVREAAPELVR